MTQAKPFAIQKREVWEAFKRVKTNHGAAGVDGHRVSLSQSERRSMLAKTCLT